MRMKRDFEYEVEDVFSLIDGGVVVVGSVKKGTMQRIIGFFDGTDLRK